MKILMSDFDDTIYFEGNEELNQKNSETIRRFVSYGNIFGIVTGRSYSDLKPYLEKYKIPYSYLLCEDGAKLFNNMDYCLDTVLISKEQVKEVEKIAKEKNWDYYFDDGYNETTNENDCVKVVIRVVQEKEKEDIVTYLKEKTSLHLYPSRKHVNIVSNEVNKENAIKKLFNLEELDYSQLYVIGDNETDYEMLKAFQGAVIKKHHKKLDSLEKKEVEYLYQYIEELMNH